MGMNGEVYVLQRDVYYVVFTKDGRALHIEAGPYFEREECAKERDRLNKKTFGDSRYVVACERPEIAVEVEDF